MKNKPLAEIMEAKFKSLVLIFMIVFIIILLMVGVLLYNNFYNNAKRDVYKDIDFYFSNFHKLFYLDENAINDIYENEENNIINEYRDNKINSEKYFANIKNHLNYILSDKKVNISLFTKTFTPYFDHDIKLKNKEKEILQKSISENKLIEKGQGIFTKNYFLGFKSDQGNNYVKIQVEYQLYQSALYVLLLIFIIVLAFQLYLRYSFENIVKKVIEPTRNLSNKMNEFEIKENMKFNLINSNIKEVDDIQNNFKEMIEEINASYEQLAAYNEEIVNQNERLNTVNKKLNTNRKKYKSLFNNMINAFAYYKVIYNEEMEAVNYQLIEYNKSFQNMFNIELNNTDDKTLSDYFPEVKDILLNKYNEVVQGNKENIHFEQYFPSEDRWFSVNAFSTYKGYFATIISDITELKKSKKDLEKLSSNLEKVISLTSVLGKKDIDEKNFLKKLLITAVEVIPEADYGTVYKNEDGKIKFIHTIGHDYQKIKDVSLPEKLFYNKKDEIEIVENIVDENKIKSKNKDFKIFNKAQKKIKETMTFDLIIEGKILAGLNIDIKESSDVTFNKNSKRIFRAFRSISTSFYRLKKYNLLQNEFTNELILSIIRMLEIHDLYTRGHSEKVANLAKKIANELDLSEKMISNTYWAGMVHDIGKILIPDHILNKKNSLIDDEYEVIQKHPVWGFQTLSASDSLQNIARYVLFHHERWDGKGYPKGLKGTEIPLISRILTVADAWDAMRSDRAYRSALSREEAKSELKLNKEKQFDPEVVEALLVILKNYEDKDIFN